MVDQELIRQKTFNPDRCPFARVLETGVPLHPALVSTAAASTPPLLTLARSKAWLSLFLIPLLPAHALPPLTLHELVTL